MPVDGFAELTLEVHDLHALERFYSDAFGLKVLQRRDDRIWLAAGEGAQVDGPIEHDGGDRSIYCEDPEGNVVEVWDFFGGDRDLTDIDDDVPQ